MAERQLMHSTVRTRWGVDQFAAIQTYRTENSDGIAFRNEWCNPPAIYSEAGGDSGVWQPRVDHAVVIRDGFGVGWSKVIFYFKSQRVEGKARIRGGKATTIAIAAIKDLDDLTISGPINDGINWRKIVKGSNIQLKPSETVVVEAAFANLDDFLPSARGARRKLNDGYLPKMRAAAEVLLLREFAYHLELPANLYYVDFLFWVSPYEDSNGTLASWNSGCYTQNAVFAPQEVPIFDIDYANTGDTAIKNNMRLGLGYVAAAPANLVELEPVTTRLFRTTSFAGIDNIIETP